MACAPPPSARSAASARFRSVRGTAEATTLAAESVDLWVAAQAFHWFRSRMHGAKHCA